MNDEFDISEWLDSCDPYVADSIRIEPMAIQEEFIRVAPDLACWTTRLSTANEGYQLAKWRAEKTEAKLRVHHRETLLQLTSKVTESQVDAAVTLDPETDVARLNLIRAEAEKIRIAGLCEAVRAKREMLVSLGAHVRSEMQGDPVIRNQHASQRGAR